MPTRHFAGPNPSLDQFSIYSSFIRLSRGHANIDGGLKSSPQVLYFTTGLVNEQDGLFGTLTPVQN
jgi:hypothetical protein